MPWVFFISIQRAFIISDNASSRARYVRPPNLVAAIPLFLGADLPFHGSFIAAELSKDSELVVLRRYGKWCRENLINSETSSS